MAIQLSTPAGKPVEIEAQLTAPQVQSALNTVPSTPQSLAVLVSQFIALPDGYTTAQIKSISIIFAGDGSAHVRVSLNS